VQFAASMSTAERLNEACEPMQQQTEVTALFPVTEGSDPRRPRVSERMPEDEPRPAVPWELALVGAAVIGVSIASVVTLAIWWPTTDGPLRQVSSWVRGAIQIAQPSPETSLPPARPQAEPGRPTSGDDMVARRHAGLGILVLQNPGRLDAVVVLDQGGRVDRAVFVRTGEQATVRDLATGTYRLRIMQGRVWGDEGFSQERVFEQLNRPVRFRQVLTEGEAERATVTVAFGTVSSTLDLQAIEPFSLPPLR
jgi:hypothetical protein